MAAGRGSSTTPLTTSNYYLGPACESTRLLNAGQFNGYRNCLCRGYAKELQVDGTSVSHRVLAEHVRMAMRTLYSRISNQQMAESLANALALHISRQAESVINDRIYNYCHKAVVTLLQLNHPPLLERWRVGGAMPKCNSEHVGRNTAIGTRRTAGPVARLVTARASTWKSR